jgi:hypothetical protein
VYLGLGLAVPDYFVGVTIHEGSHAIAAKLLGGDVTSLHLYPGHNPFTGHFQFGWTITHGVPTTEGATLFFLGAPKITDAVLFGGYIALYATGTHPGNLYLWDAMNVFATGLWVDFAKDVVVFHPFDDVVRMFDAVGWHKEWGWRLPARIVYGAIDAAAGYVVYLGWRDLFRANNTAVAPLYGGAF